MFFQVVGGIGFDYENSGLHSEGPDSPGNLGSPGSLGSPKMFSRLVSGVGFDYEMSSF